MRYVFQKLWACELNAKDLKPAPLITFVVLLGSNIAPERNIPIAVKLLAEHLQVCGRSSVWETEAVGFPGSPNFFNLAILVKTELHPHRLKETILHGIENQLGRIRTSNKNAPRTIDLDIILVNDKVVEMNLWTCAFIAIPVADLLPNLPGPKKTRLSEIAKQLHKNNFAVVRPDILIEIN